MFGPSNTIPGVPESPARMFTPPTVMSFSVTAPLSVTLSSVLVFLTSILSALSVPATVMSSPPTMFSVSSLLSAISVSSSVVIVLNA